MSGLVPKARRAVDGMTDAAGRRMDAEHRPRGELPGRRLVLPLAGFSGLTALLGGLQLLIWSRGAPWVPIELLEPTAFRSFLVPGLVLGLVVGGSSLACTLFVWRRSRFALDLTVLAGGAMLLWILAEAAQLRAFHWLQALYGGLGLLLLGLGLRAAWRSGQPRHRWIVVVTSAETLGFLVPVSAGLLSAAVGLEGASRWLLLVGAGCVEGALLGLGQTQVLELPLRRGRYALLTALGAALVWALMMGGMTLGPSLEGLPTPVAIGAGLLAAVIGLSAIGAAQWLELRRHAARAGRWIAWTALAWAVALPLSFLPGPLVDERTPIWANLVLWASAGVLMAYVMANLTWFGVRALGGIREAA